MDAFSEESEDATVVQQMPEPASPASADQGRPAPPIASEGVALPPTALPDLSVGLELAHDVDLAEEALFPDFGAEPSIGDSPTLTGMELAAVARSQGTGADDTAADRSASPGAGMLARFLELSERDHYSFLSMPEDADSEQVKVACGRVEKELLVLRDQVLPAQRPQVVALLGRLERARRVLDDLEARAAYDARRGNHRGVARCMAAGLAPARVDKLRQDYIRRSPELVDRARKLAQEAQDNAEKGGVERAALVISQALALDPLSRELQRRLEELLQSGDGAA